MTLDFALQLELLESLEGGVGTFTPQMNLELAILLHQRDRHHEVSDQSPTAVLVRVSRKLMTELAKHYVQPSPMPAPNNNFLINQQAWDSLPDDIKAIMQEAAKLASLDYLARGVELDAKAMAEMVEAGVEVSQIPEEEWATMEKKARELWSEYAENDDLSARAVSLMHEFLSDIGR